MGSQQQSKNQLASLVDAGDDMDWLDENEQVVEDSGV